MKRLRVAHRRGILIPRVADAFAEHLGMAEIFRLNLGEARFCRSGGKIFHHAVATHQKGLEEIAVRCPREGFHRIRPEAQYPGFRQPAAVRIAFLDVYRANRQKIRQIVGIDQCPRQVNRPVDDGETRRINRRITVI